MGERGPVRPGLTDHDILVWRSRDCRKFTRSAGGFPQYARGDGLSRALGGYTTRIRAFRGGSAPHSHALAGISEDLGDFLVLVIAGGAYGNNSVR